MIRALRAALLRIDARRAVGFVALAALLFVVVLGAVHAGQDAAGHDHGHGCGVCSAAALLGASVTFAPPQLGRVLDVVDPVEPRRERRFVAAEPAREPTPRPPPSPVE